MPGKTDPITGTSYPPPAGNTMRIGHLSRWTGSLMSGWDPIHPIDPIDDGNRWDGLMTVRPFTVWSRSELVDTARLARPRTPFGNGRTSQLGLLGLTTDSMLSRSFPIAISVVASRRLGKSSVDDIADATPRPSASTLHGVPPVGQEAVG